MTLFTPRSTPRVSNNQKVFTTFITVTNSSYSMIKWSSTSRCVKDTAFVSLELNGSSINSNSCRLNVKSSFYLSYTFWRYSCISCNFYLSLSWCKFACFITGCIWIGRQKFNAIVFSISKSINFKPSIAACVTIWTCTINKLLFWKLNKRTSLNSMSRFYSTCWCKSPTRTTLSLILNCIYFTLTSPIYCNSELFSRKLNWFLI